MPGATSGPPGNADLHGSVPDKSAVAVVVIDVINDLEFEGGDALVGPARAMAGALGPLLDRARAAGVPVIYADCDRVAATPSARGRATQN